MLIRANPGIMMLALEVVLLDELLVQFPVDVKVNEVAHDIQVVDELHVAQLDIQAVQFGTVLIRAVLH